MLSRSLQNYLKFSSRSCNFKCVDGLQLSLSQHLFACALIQRPGAGIERPSRQHASVGIEMNCSLLLPRIADIPFWGEVPFPRQWDGPRFGRSQPALSRLYTNNVKLYRPPIPKELYMDLQVSFIGDFSSFPVSSHDTWSYIKLCVNTWKGWQPRSHCCFQL